MECINILDNMYYLDVFKTFNANTTGFHLGNEYSTVDIEGNLEENKIREIELFANEIIRQNIQVETLLPTKKN